MRDGRTTTSEDRATQLLICEALSLATMAWQTLRNWRRQVTKSEEAGQKALVKIL